MIFIRLFYEFFKTGLFAVGGGLATLPFLYDMSDRLGLFTRQELATMIAVSESTPGPIGVNMATYAGFHSVQNEYGSFLISVLGACVTTAALVFPSLVIIVIIAKFLAKFGENKFVNGAFYTLRPAVAGLIGAAVLGIYQIAFLTMDSFKKTHNFTDFIDLKSFIIFVVILFLVLKLKKHPIIYIALGAVSGLILNTVN